MPDTPITPTPPPPSSVTPPPVSPVVPPIAPKKPTRAAVDPKKAIIGCFAIAFFLFVILIGAMVMGLAAGEATIRNFGFDPISFKNWTINLVSLVFGTIAITFVIAIILQIVRALFASSDARPVRVRAARHGAVHTTLLIVTIIGWYMAYNALNAFLTDPGNLKVDILVNQIVKDGVQLKTKLGVPVVDTLGLTSPATLYVSAELVTRKFTRDYNLVSYQWDLNGDGAVDATGEKTQLYFQDGGKNNGVYDVVLRVGMQPRGGTGKMETKEYHKTVSIDKQEMYGDILVDRESGNVPLRVKFDASAIRDPQGAQITNYKWDLDGDGIADFDGPMYGRVEYLLDTIGDHTVSVIVRSSDFAANGIDSEEKKFTKKIVVHEPGELKNADAVIRASPLDGIAPLDVTFDGSESGQLVGQPIERFEWNVNDGADKFFGVRNVYTFKKAGTYPVTLKVVYASGHVRTSTVTIKVTDQTFAPTAVITTKPTAGSQGVAGAAPFDVTFDGSDSRDADNNIVSYKWDYDEDGVFDAEGSRVTHEFLTSGVYRIRLKVTDVDGAISDAYVPVTVSPEAPTVAIGTSTVAGVAPLDITFDGSGSRMPGRRVVSYTWDFGDGAAQPAIYQKAQTSHVFVTPGTYRVALTIRGDDGTTATNSTMITATQPALLSAFTASRLTGTAPLAVTFDSASSSGAITRYAWDFGDGSVSDTKKPSHIFSKAGTYVVTLRVYDTAGALAVAEQTVEVK